MALPPRHLVFVGGRRSQCPRPSPTLGSLGPSHQQRHKSRVLIRGPPCVHGVLGTPHGKVCDKLALDAPVDASAMPIAPHNDIPKAKVPFFVPSSFFTLVFCILHVRTAHFTNARPKPPLINFPLHSSYGVVSQVAPCLLGERPSSTSSLNRHALKAASSESDLCLALRRSARHSPRRRPRIPLTLPLRTIQEHV